METAIDKTIEKLQNQNHLPEAIFALNNNLTSYCLSALKRLKISVPNDVALISFDDMLYFDFTNPSISAVAQPVEQIGEQAFDLLLKQINLVSKAEDHQTVILPVNLIVRESSIKN